MIPRLARFLGFVPMLALAGGLFGLSGCTSSRPFVGAEFRDWEAETPPDRSALTHRVFLVGDTADEEDAATLWLLREQLEEAGEHSTVVFLGDQLRRGLPDSLSADYVGAEFALWRVLGVVEGFEGRVVVIPGDDDARGTDALDRQAAFFRAHLGDGVFLPPDGLAGPVDLRLDDGLVLIVLDTGWWLRDPDDRVTGDVEGEEGAFEIASELDVLIALNELLAEYDDERILVVGHHPVFANGPRGGHFSLRQHVFPLTDLWRPLYVPLPVVGSLYPLARSFMPGRQDLAHPEYRELREGLVPVIEEHDGIVYAAAHERGLQYTPLRTDAMEIQHHVLSGGTGEASPMARGHDAAFAHGHPGFASLQYYEDGTVWVEFWEPDEAGGRLAFRTRIAEARPDDVEPEIAVVDPAAFPDYTDSTRVVAADPGLRAGPVKRFFFGDSYRDAWTTPVSVPVLDLGREHGGLVPMKRGGGYQTVSLRMVNPEEREFVLRQVRKRPDLLLPPALRPTFAADVLADQMQTSNPYAALAVPVLADAAGIYHATPQARVIPDDPRLGTYQEAFANTFVLVEERPAGDVSALPHFGGAEDVDGTTTMLQQLRGDNDVRVDQPFFLRNRLFDLLIGDWDRHEDQWRWAQFEPFELDPSLEGDARTQGRVYRAIPRDRDQAFFRLSGLLPRLARFVVRGLDDFFREDFDHVLDLTENSIALDRRLLNELSREEWQAVARDLQARLTDDVLREALTRWPPEIDALYGEDVLRTLQSRRDQLPEAADDFYELLARVVDVVGSDKHERFVVEHRDGETEVTVYKTNKEGEDQKVIYHRVFFHDETRELRLYGLSGRDRFEIRGVGSGPYVRVVGGPGEDTFVDRTGARRAHYYDSERGNTIELGRARLSLSDAPENNSYDPDSYTYPYYLVMPFVAYNATDGPFLGAGVTFIRPGFRREPYSASHTIRANVATYTGAVNVGYRGHWVDRIGGFDAVVEAEGATPQNVRNFYGFGNETVEEQGASYYYVRMAHAALGLGVEAELAPGATVELLPSVSVAKVDPAEGTIFADPGSGLARDFEDEWYAGGDAALILERVDRSANPRQGFRWQNRAGVRVAARNADGAFGTLDTDLAVYFSPSLAPQVTLALRTGATHLLGDDVPFYHAATLGGTENLRGYRSTRFTGRTAAYQNAEARLQLFDFQTYAATGDFGLIGFVDNGRVWVRGEDSSTWHLGYGGGLWLNLYDLFIVSGTVAFSEEGPFLNVGTGFRF